MKSAVQATLHLLAAAGATLRRLAARRDGQVAIFFGLAAIPVIIGAGMAMDTARAYMVKTRLGAALDSAALAVGSETSLGATTLNTDLNNFFFSNYCKSTPTGTSLSSCLSTVAGEASISVQATTSITAATVSYQAQATVPTIFMRLVGVNNLTVQVTAQTTKFPGMEIAVVLDNTGSMLCNGAATASSGYNPCGPTTSTVGTNAASCPSESPTATSNPSRICTLIPAAQQFVTTLNNAIAAPQSLYMAIVPYVTAVNIGNNSVYGSSNSGLCGSTGASCNNIATDSCGTGDFIDPAGNLIYDTTQTPLTVNTSTFTVTGTTQSSPNQKIIKSISPNTSGMAVGEPITGTGIPANTTISSIDSSTQIHISNNATSAGTGRTLTVTKGGATTTSGSATVTLQSAASGTLAVGMIVTGAGIPAMTAIQTVTSQTNITLCNNATATASFVSLSFYTPVTYDSAFNTNLGSSTTKNWGGCVIEPTSSDENSSVSGVINFSAYNDPDYVEPRSGVNWYPLYWLSQNDTNAFSNDGNNWSSQTANSVKVQDKTTETQGASGTGLTTYDNIAGPNEGCPVPMLPLTDLTDSTGLATVQAAINSMWPRDSAGTQVHVGMIWGWRVLDPDGPFAANNGHPLDYATANSTGWKKVVVLMTDGTEEWPTSADYTGLGPIADGKIGTTSTGTAPSKLDTRLQTLCSNMQAEGILIYTIGLAYDGQHNTILDSDCPSTVGGVRQYYPAGPPGGASLSTVFQEIAASIIHLRLTR